MKLNKRRAIAGFEVVIMIASLFAFSYFICASEDIFRKLKEPLIPVVSAEQVNTTLEDGSILTENITRTVFSISSNEFGAGCCSLAMDKSVRQRRRQHVLKAHFLQKEPCAVQHPSAEKVVATTRMQEFTIKMF